jgi:hypothetical protein
MTAAQMFWASMAVTAASTATNFYAQSEQANAQADYQSKMAEANNAATEQNAKMANQEYIDQTTAENIQLMQKQEATSIEMQRIQRERKEAVGTALASSEGAGMSLQFLMDDYYRQEANYKGNLQTQLDNDKASRDIAVKGYWRTAYNRGQSQQGYIAAPTSQPSALGAGLGFAGSALDTYGRYRRDSLKDRKSGV